MSKSWYIIIPFARGYMATSRKEGKIIQFFGTDRVAVTLEIIRLAF